MTPAIGHAILAVSNSLAASIIVKATIVISIALVAATLARHSRASVRHAILAAGFAVLLALPIAAIVAPPLHIALPIAQGSSTLATNSLQSVNETSLAPRAATNASSSAAKSEATTFSLLDFVFAAWIIGAAIFLAPVTIGLWQIRSLRRTALPWSYGTSVAATLADELKISRRIEVLLHEAVAGPMTCGVFHPAIVFPMEAQTWNEADLNRAVAHELEHVGRADWLTHCLARAVCAAYWFHPLTWIAWRQLTLEAERACDDAVLAHSEATAYAEQLVALARQLTAAHKSPLLAMASRSDLTARIHAVLDSRQSRGRMGRFAFMLACGVAALLIVTFSPIQFVTAQPQAQNQQASSTRLPKFEVASIKRVFHPPHMIMFDGDNPGRYTAKNMPAKLLIEFAYDVTDFQIIGGPSWINSEAFDINAKIDDATANRIRHLNHDEQEAQKAPMLQSLLADRFNLKITRETKEAPVFEMVVAKGGAKLVEAPCLPQESPVSAPPPARGSNGLHVLPPCEDEFTIRNRGATIRANAEPLSELASMLSPQLRRPVLDRTGLKGTYNFQLQFDLESAPGGNPLPLAQDTDAQSAPSLFSAMQEQLGLRLESTKAAVETILIDHIDEPSPN